MPTYIYEALNEEGRIVRGLVDAENRGRALTLLKQYRFKIKNLHEQTKLQIFYHRLFGVSEGSIALLTHQFAVMMKAGLPLTRCLDLLSRKGENRRIEDVLLLVREHVQGGNTLSQSLARYPDVFDPVFLALIEAGEASGQVGNILERIASYKEKDVQLKKRVKAAMIYPFIIFIFCLVMSAGLILYIFPKFISLFEGFHLQMPLLTRILIFMVYTLKNPFVLVLGVGTFGVLSFLFSQYAKTSLGRKHCHRMLLNAPLFGRINKKVAVSRFCRTLSTLTQEGFPILHALEIVSRVTGNEVVNEAIDQTKEAVRYGSSISYPLFESGIFPPMVIGMIQVGEETGLLDTVLKKIADYYDLEVEISLVQFTKLLEPVLIGVMGLVVGFVVLSIFMPIYQLIGNFGK